MKKTILLWFCDVDTSKKETSHLFENLQFDEVIILNHSESKAEQRAHRSLWNPVSWFKKSKRHKTLAQRAFLIITSILQREKNKLHLIVGGHGRGAVDGVLDLISIFYQDCQKKERLHEDFLWDKIVHISLVATDPLSDPKSAHPSSFSALPKDQKRISFLLKAIEQQLKAPALFQLVLYTSRFEARDEFKLNEHWLEFQNKPGKFANRFEHFVAGFRHSSMIVKREEITKLYQNNNSPINLLKHILHDLKNNTNGALIVYQELIFREFILISRLKPVSKAVFEKNDGFSDSQSLSVSKVNSSLKIVLGDQKISDFPLSKKENTKHS
ncbi:MAG: hypothetical protein MI810_24940 [Flavobacteriales bacterium]|nr:hypothetical protein [Flavobacteriales bacterium]